MDFENDPAADFLNREREELAGIINDAEGLLNWENNLRKFVINIAISFYESSRPDLQHLFHV